MATKALDNMAHGNEHGSDLFSRETRDSFLQYLADHPNSRRVSQSEQSNIRAWLTNPERRPASQQDFSRRHYIQKTFAWDTDRQVLVAVAKGGKENRDVVTEENIVDTVGLVHTNNGHAGWDATWKGISTSYHGILRADVIFLLKQCQVCAGDPRKRPKGQTNPGSDSLDECSPNLFSFDILHDLASDILPEEGKIETSDHGLSMGHSV
ncbi:hypothetical protein NCS52_00117100 [Fusarium sp. LHS14.1]|nr:hypothetical protein NCS52_00117100 [Fusarium sp. LHS14.1]